MHCSSGTLGATPVTRVTIRVGVHSVAFKVFDVDGDGRLSRMEFVQMLGMLRQYDSEELGRRDPIVNGARSHLGGQPRVTHPSLPPCRPHTRLVAGRAQTRW